MGHRLWTVSYKFIYVFIFFFLITGGWFLGSAFITLGLYLLLMLLRIKPVDQEVSQEMLGPEGKPMIIGHRGAKDAAPENTIGAFRYAKENGADGCEFDVAYTKEGIAVLLHDDSLERTTDGTGNIEDVTLSYAQSLNAAVNDAARPGYTSENIPTLEEAVQTCLNLGLRMYIDCKASPKKTAKTMAALFKKYPELYKRALVCSFYIPVIYSVRLADPKIVTGLIFRPGFMTKTIDMVWRKDHSLPERCINYAVERFIGWAHKAFFWYLCGISAISLMKDATSKLDAKYYQSLGIRVIIWSPSNSAEKDYFHKHLGLDIITDTLKIESDSYSIKNC